MTIPMMMMMMMMMIAQDSTQAPTAKTGNSHGCIGDICVEPIGIRK